MTTKGDVAMPQVPVAVADEAGTIKAHPGVQPLSRGDSLVVANATDREISVWFPEPIFTQGTGPHRIAPGAPLSLTLADAPYGFYPYAIYYSAGDRHPAPGGRLVLGNSAPGVIVKP
jgi:hypothetical protein